MKRFALAGNPNCGKTTLFNALTGSTAHVGNWPGVTVEKKDGTYKKLLTKKLFLVTTSSMKNQIALLTSLMPLT